MVFDLDDTLIDWSGAETAALRDMSETHLAGYTWATITACYGQIQAENVQTFRTEGRWHYVAERLGMLGQRLGSDVPAEILAATFKSRVKPHLRLLPGAVETLAAARQGGRKVALLTNGPSAIQRPKLDAFHLAPAFDYVGVTGEMGHWKPSPKAFRHVLSQLDVAAERTLMVGDSLDFDIRPAKALGMRTAWIHDLAGEVESAGSTEADLVVAGPQDLAPLWA